MALGCDENYSYNTFIFNWVKNYNYEVNNLKVAIESAQNKAQVHNHLTYDQLTEAVEKLCHANFELYNYIAVIILDNECEFENFIRTSDKQNVPLYSEILTRIQTNPTLQNIKRLFVIQKLLDCTDMDDEINVHKISNMIKERQSTLKQSAVLYSGLTISIRAGEYTNNFTSSPFIKVFSRNFRNYVKALPMDKIHKGMLREIKYLRGYKINLEFGSNESTTSDLILGNGICGDILRDFF